MNKTLKVLCKILLKSNEINIKTVEDLESYALKCVECIQLITFGMQLPTAVTSSERSTYILRAFEPNVLKTQEPT